MTDEEERAAQAREEAALDALMWLALRGDEDDHRAVLEMLDDPPRRPTMSWEKTLLEMDEVELRELMARVARAVEAVLPPGPSRKGKALFMLLVFDDPGLAQYVSNCDRSTAVEALREAADRMEGREDIPR